MLHSSTVRCRAESEDIFRSGRKAAGARDLEAGGARDFSLLDCGMREPHGWAIPGGGNSVYQVGKLERAKRGKEEEKLETVRGHISSYESFASSAARNSPLLL